MLLLQMVYLLTSASYHHCYVICVIIADHAHNNIVLFVISLQYISTCVSVIHTFHTDRLCFYNGQTSAMTWF